MAFRAGVYFGSFRSISASAQHSVEKHDIIMDKLGMKEAVKDKNVVIKIPKLKNRFGYPEPPMRVFATLFLSVESILSARKAAVN